MFRPGQIVYAVNLIGREPPVLFSHIETPYVFPTIEAAVKLAMQWNKAVGGSKTRMEPFGVETVTVLPGRQVIDIKELL